MSAVAASLRTRLKAAMAERDRATISVCRTALAALANAEAVPVEAIRAGAIELSPVGVGATEAPRRELTETDARAVVQTELDELREALGHASGVRADELRAAAAVLESVLAD